MRDFSLQLTDSTNVFIQYFDLKRNNGFNFSTELYEGSQLKYRLVADQITWKPKDSLFTLNNYRIRKIFNKRDSIFSGRALDTVLPFRPLDLKYSSALAQEMPSDELYAFIKTSQKRGIKNLNGYLVEFHKRTSLPISSYILTIIAVALAFKKKRGGTGMNLATGFGLMFVYIFFLKVSEVFGAVAGANSLLNVWIPNILFGLLALYLFYHVRK